MTSLLRRCCEPGCEKILINNRWVGKKYVHYQEEIDKAEGITDRYCPRHRENNYLKRQLNERRRLRSLNLT